MVKRVPVTCPACNQVVHIPEWNALLYADPLEIVTIGICKTIMAPDRNLDDPTFTCPREEVWKRRGK